MKKALIGVSIFVVIIIISLLFISFIGYDLGKVAEEMFADVPVIGTVLTAGTNEMRIKELLEKNEVIQSKLDEIEREKEFLEYEVNRKESRLEEKREEIVSLGSDIEDLKISQHNSSLQLSHLADIYEGMRPEEASAILEQIDHEFVARLIYEMEESKASRILGAMDSTAAAEIMRSMID